jgi:hypothetical protein
MQIGARLVGHGNKIGSAKMPWLTPYNTALTPAEIARLHNYIKRLMAQRGVVIS